MDRSEKLSPILPYTMTVIIHDILGFENQENPLYLVLDIDGKILGRTVPSRVGQIRSTWSTLQFSKKLFHLSNDLNARVFTQLSPNKEIFSGSMTISLVSIPLNSMETFTSDLNSGYQIVMTVFIEKSIKLFNLSETRRTDVGNQLMLTKIGLPEDDIKRIYISDPVSTALLRIFSETSNLDLISRHRGLIEDILIDANFLNPQSAATYITSTSRSMRIRRHETSSSILTMATCKCRESLPQPGLTIIFDVSGSFAHKVEIVFPNKYMLWFWAKWIRLAKEYSKRNLDRTDLFVATALRRGSALVSESEIVFSVDCETQVGACSLDLDRPHELQCFDMNHGLPSLIIPLQSVQEISISADSSEPKNYTIQFKSIQVHIGATVANITSLYHSSQDLTSESSSSPLAFGVDRYSTDLISKAVPSSASFTSATCSIRDSSQALKARSDLDLTKSFGVLIKIGSQIRFTSRKIEALDLTWNTILDFDLDDADIPLSMVDSFKVSMVDSFKVYQHTAAAAAATAVAARHESPSSGDTPDDSDSDNSSDSDSSVDATTVEGINAFKLSMGGIEGVNTDTGRNSNRNTKSTTHSYRNGNGSSVVMDDDGVSQLEVFLFQGEDSGKEQLVCYGAVPIRQLLVQYPQDQRVPLYSSSSMPTATYLMGLDETLELQIVLLAASGLCTSLDSASDSGSRHLYSICKCVTASGDDACVNKSGQMAPPCPAASSVAWSQHTFKVKVDHGLMWCKFIQIEILVHSLNSAENQSLGACFIPIEDFNETSIELKTYALVNTANATVSETRTPMFTSGIGTVTVDILKILKKSPEVATIALTHSLFANDLYKASYPVDVMAANAFDAPTLPRIDFMSLTASFEGLEMVDEPRSCRDNLVIEVYENEGRSLTPPFAFSPEHLQTKDPLTHRPHFSDERGSKDMEYEPPINGPAPPGYEWGGPWRLDKSYTQSDPEGWSYAFTYSALRENMSKGHSLTYPQHTKRRRRKWVRIAVPLPSLSADDELGATGDDTMVTTDMTALVTNPSSLNSTTQEAMDGSSGNDLCMIEVFENQGRRLYPPFAYGPGNMLQHPTFSDESGAQKSEYEPPAISLAPDGFKWAGAWVPDTTYTQTDPQGWSYGFTFNALRSNYLKGHSCTHPLNTHCRRRKWVRAIVPTGSAQSHSSSAQRQAQIQRHSMWHGTVEKDKSANVQIPVLTNSPASYSGESEMGNESDVDGGDDESWMSLSAQEQATVKHNRRNWRVSVSTKSAHDRSDQLSPMLSREGARSDSVYEDDGAFEGGLLEPCVTPAAVEDSDQTICQALPPTGLREAVHHDLGILASIELRNSQRMQPRVSTSFKQDYADAINSAVTAHTSAILIETFENEGRQMYPPFKFGPGNIVGRPWFSDKGGRTTSPYTPKDVGVDPPAGYRWAGNWMIDREYAHTDTEGWLYAVTYSLFAVKTHCSAQHATRRRRKWVRKAEPVDFESTGSECAQSLQGKSPEGRVPHARSFADTAILPASLMAASTLSTSSSPSPFSPPDSPTSGTRTTGTPTTATPSAGTASAASSTRHFYGTRLWEFENNPDSIPRLCQERDAVTSNRVLVPWHQVTSVHTVTASILSLTIILNKFIGVDARGCECFEPAHMDLFVSNCPAHELLDFIKERVSFGSIRNRVKAVIEHNSRSSSTRIVTASSQDRDYDVSLLAGSLSSYEEGAIETEEISSASSQRMQPHASKAFKQDYADASNSAVIAHTSAILVETFENEGRQMYPPFKFGPGNIVGRPWFSDKGGRATSPYTPKDVSADPPAGYRWAGNWTIDREYAHTDTEGWLYAVTYSLFAVKTHCSAQHATRRRRKWVRKAEPVDVRSQGFSPAAGVVTASPTVACASLVDDAGDACRGGVDIEADVEADPSPHEPAEPLSLLEKEVKLCFEINSILSVNEEQILTIENILAQKPTTVVSSSLPSYEELKSDIFSLKSRAWRLNVYIASIMDASKAKAELPALEFIDLALAGVSSALGEIHSDDEIVTLQNRIELVLDSIETLFLEASFSGWTCDKETLQNYLQKLCNDYFLLFVGLVSPYFESKANFLNAKGIGQKSHLLLIYLKYNHCFAEAFASAFKLLELTISPSPSLSMYFDLDAIFGWYAVVVGDEAASKAEDIFQYWKDPTKAASGQESRYKHALPWVPMRKQELSGPFMTLLPEDLQRMLAIFQSFVCPSKSEIHVQYHDRVDTLEELMDVAFVNVYMRISEEFAAALASQDWLHIHTSSSARSSLGTGRDVDTEGAVEELVERSEWLSSLCDDIERLTDPSYMTFNQMREGKSSQLPVALATVLQQAYVSLQSTSRQAIDLVSCIVFRLLVMNESLWLVDDAHSIWFPTSFSDSENDDGFSSDGNDGSPDSRGDRGGRGDRKTISRASLSPPPTNSRAFESMLNDLLDVLANTADNVESSSYLQLLECCADRLVGFYLHVLKSAGVAGRFWDADDPEVARMSIHIERMKQLFSDVVTTANHPHFYESILPHFRLLDFALNIIKATDLATCPQLEATIRSLLRIAEGNPRQADSIASFTEACIYLRSDCTLLKPQKRRNFAMESLRASVKMATYTTRSSQLNTMHDNHSDSDCLGEDSTRGGSIEGSVHGVSVAGEGGDTVSSPFDAIMSRIKEIRNSYASVAVTEGRILYPIEVFSSGLNRPAVSLRTMLLEPHWACRQHEQLSHSQREQELMGGRHATARATAIGIVEVTGLKAMNLPKIYSSGREIEPFVRLAIEVSGSGSGSDSGKDSNKSTSVSGEMAATTVATGKNPSWESETFELSCHNVGGSSTLVCTICYMGMIMGHDVVGEVRVRLSSINIARVNETFPINFSASPKAYRVAMQGSLSEWPNLSVRVQLKL